MNDPRVAGKLSSMKLFGCLAVCFLLVVPIVMVSLPGISILFGRAIAISSFALFATLGALWIGISPKSKMIRKGAKLNEPQFANVRPYIERGMRVLFVAFGVFFFVEVTLPLALDMFRLASGERPSMLTARVADKTTAFAGVLLGECSVRLAPGGDSYYLFYSWTSPLRAGEKYAFTILPRSRMILDFHEVRVAGDR